MADLTPLGLEKPLSNEYYNIEKYGITMDLIDQLIAARLEKALIANNLLSDNTNQVLAAPQGKVLDGKIDEINNNLAGQAGSWTPTVYGSITPGAPTYSVQWGTYIKIGKLVYINARIELLSKGGIAGSVFIGGLPFVPEVDHNAISIGDLSGHNLAKGALSGNIRAVGRIDIKQYDATTINYINDTSITDAFYIMFSGVYRTAQ